MNKIYKLLGLGLGFLYNLSIFIHMLLGHEPGIYVSVMATLAFMGTLFMFHFMANEVAPLLRNDAEIEDEEDENDEE